jgi:hypothetical protein
MHLLSLSFLHKRSLLRPGTQDLASRRAWLWPMTINREKTRARRVQGTSGSRPVSGTAGLSRAATRRHARWSNAVGGDFERRAVEGQPETPSPRQYGLTPGPMGSDGVPRRITATPSRRRRGPLPFSPLVDGFGALVAPRPARPVAGVCLPRSTTSRGYNRTMCVLATGVGKLSSTDQHWRQISRGRIRGALSSSASWMVRIHRASLKEPGRSGHCTPPLGSSEQTDRPSRCGQHGDGR